MGRYYKSSEKVSGVMRPILPQKFILKDGWLLWDDTHAVYDAGMIESSEDGFAWDAFTIFLPDEERMIALPELTHYRMRVKYNSHWSVYLNSEEAELVKKVAVKKPTKAKAIGAQ